MAELTSHADVSLAEVQAWAALGAGVSLCLMGLSRRSVPGLCLSVAAAPLLFRGVTGHWPFEHENGVYGHGVDEVRWALAGSRGVRVQESVRIERPVSEVYASWLPLGRLPEIMTHLESVTELGDDRSRWVARGPAGLRVTWDAEIFNEVPEQVIAWRSLPGADVVTAGSVTFTDVAGTATKLTVSLQYAPPAGHAGALAAKLFGREPSQTIREDLRRFKQLLEAGEVARVDGLSAEVAR